MNKTILILPALIASLGLIPAGRVMAQDFIVLHRFTASPVSPAVNSDGGNPYSALILSGNTLYGAAINGGSSGNGTVFRVSTDGTAFTNLHSFTGDNDGTGPNAGFALSGNILYGTAASGGDSGRGTVFAVHTDGTGFTNLHSFTAGADNSEGGVPNAGLVLSGNVLYGAVQYGGSANAGTVFAINTDGTGFTNLHNFTGGGGGAYPHGGLILSSNTLYGTASGGGSLGKGTVFAVHAGGTGFTNLYHFTGLSDGAYPIAGLILSGNTLYGTTTAGGGSGAGTVFAVNTSGTGFTNLHGFTALSLSTNSDGASPGGGLILSGDTLFGTAASGGSSGAGTVFAVGTNGTGFTTLYSFMAVNNSTNSEGAYPWAGLVFSGNTLYGTASAGGTSGMGTVFGLALPPVTPPRLTIFRSGANVILTWPANAGFTLQSKPASTGAFTNLAGATSPYTNRFNSARQFFRLISN